MRIFSIIIAAFNPLDQQSHIYSKIYDDLIKNEVLKESSMIARFKVVCKSTASDSLPKGSSFMLNLDDGIKAYIVTSIIAPIAVYAFCDSTYSKKAAFLLLRQALKNFEVQHANTYYKHTKDKNLECGLSELLSYYQFPIDLDDTGKYAKMAQSALKSSEMMCFNDVDFLQKVKESQNVLFENRTNQKNFPKWKILIKITVSLFSRLTTQKSMMIIKLGYRQQIITITILTFLFFFFFSIIMGFHYLYIQYIYIYRL